MKKLRDKISKLLLKSYVDWHICKEQSNGEPYCCSYVAMLTRLPFPLKFVSAHIGSNYLCINLEM